MQRIYSLVIILLLAASCAGLPRIHPPEPSHAPEFRNACGLPFPTGKWRFVHSIEATMLNRKGVLMGVTLISPDENTIHCVIMTIEGFVLLDALYDGELVVSRGVPPFDSENIARGLMEDIRLALFKPDGMFAGTGRFDDGRPVCRYQNADGTVVDVIPQSPDAAWEIRQYDENGYLKRRVTARPAENQNTIPGKLEITAYGRMRYALVLELIQVEALE